MARPTLAQYPNRQAQFNPQHPFGVDSTNEAGQVVGQEGFGDSMSYAGDILRAKRQELAAQASELRKSIREIDAALELLGEAEGSKSVGSSASPINAAIVEAVSQGCSTPAQIYNFVTHVKEIDTSKNSISTRLSKLKNDGVIDNNENGWVPKKAEGSDIGTSEPSKDMGPVTGRERGYPPSAPEGSIPSGSTASRLSPDEDDGWDTPIHRRPLTDEIPF